MNSEVVEEIQEGKTYSWGHWFITQLGNHILMQSNEVEIVLWTGSVDGNFRFLMNGDLHNMYSTGDAVIEYKSENDSVMARIARRVLTHRTDVISAFPEPNKKYTLTAWSWNFICETEGELKISHSQARNKTDKIILKNYSHDIHVITNGLNQSFFVQ